MLAAAATIAGCGGGSGAGSAGEPQAQIGGPSGTELADQQVLHVGNGAELQTLDPHRAEDTAELQCAPRPLRRAHQPVAEGRSGPGRRNRVDRQRGRQDVRVQSAPRGALVERRCLTAHDFVFSLRRAVDPKTLSVYSYILTPLLNADEITAGKRPPEELGVRAIDDYTLEITLANPTSYFLAASLALDGLSRPPRDARDARRSVDEARQPRRQRRVHARRVRWCSRTSKSCATRTTGTTRTRSSRKSGSMRPRIRRPSCSAFARSSSTMTEIIPAAQIGFIRENLADELVIAPYLGSYYYGFNVTRPPFKDNPKLRRALSLAVNRDIITKQILNLGQISAFGFVPPIKGYTQQQMPEASWTQERARGRGQAPLRRSRLRARAIRCARRSCTTRRRTTAASQSRSPRCGNRRSASKPRS